MRILVADDEKLNCQLIGTYLTQWGHQPELFTKSQKAFEALIAHDAPRIAVLDWVMPGMSGIDIIKKMRTEYPALPLYIILLTGKTEKHDIIEGLAAGADDYIAKPFDFEELKSRIEVGVRIVDLQLNLERRALEHQQLISAIHAILIGISAAKEVIFWNKEASRFSGIDAAHAIGKNFLELALPWNSVKVADLVQTFSDDFRDEMIGEVDFSKDMIDGIMQITLNRLERDGTDGILLVGEDITEKRLIELRSQHSQKLESIGQLAAGIAHEINTPLQYVMDNVAFFRDSLKEMSCFVDTLITESATPNESLVSLVSRLKQEHDIDFITSEIQPAIAKTYEGIERIRRIVLAMKEFAHPSQEAFQLGDINKAIGDTIAITRNAWKYSAEVVIDLDPELEPLNCLISELNQVFLNLIINAADAIKEKQGQLSAHKGLIHIATCQKEHTIEIRIQDNGTGIPEHIKSRIFDPFFTTKGVGIGSGQGLSICREIIVNKHKGSIDFHTKSGEGTCFVITLPR